MKGQTLSEFGKSRSRHIAIKNTLLTGLTLLLAAPAMAGGEIFEAVTSGDYETVSRMIDEGADLDARTDGWTPMITAAIGGRTKMVRLFLDHGVDVNQQGARRWTALIAASRYGKEEVAALVLERGADVNVRVKGSSYTALLSAITHDHREIALMILEKEIDPNVISSTSWTPLMAAAKKADVEIVRALLEKGAKPNLGPRRTSTLGEFTGSTALYEAAARGHFEIVKLLVEHGANIYLIPDNKSPYRVANKRGHKEVAEYIKSVHEAKYGNKKYGMLK